MQELKLKKGLDLPISGAPEQKVHDAPKVKSFALIGSDYIDLKPRLNVEEGEEVKRGQTIFFNKSMPDVKMVSPVTGRIKAVNRGLKRVLESVVIESSDISDKGIDFSDIGDSNSAKGIAKKLCASGLWTSFRTRPYSKIPDPETQPEAIFITAIDTEPLSPDAKIIIDENAKAFAQGVETISLLNQGSTYLCHEIENDVPGADVKSVKAAAFSGPHPAGLAGTHIHFLQSPKNNQVVWTIGYQDVIAIGNLVITGFLDSSRVIALSGPLCKNPRLVKTISGASTEDLMKDNYDSSVPVRMISGSVLSGREASGTKAYLDRYARQITVIEEDKKQIPLGWIRPMSSKFAFQPVLGSAFSKKMYDLTSNLNGGRRAMVPTGTFEQIMPQDFLPTQLLRALLVMDTDTAQALGALELDEEDLALSGFSCPAKYEYGTALRDCLTKIEKEG